MQAFTKVLREFGYGLATGTAACLVLALFGFLGGEGWQSETAGRAIGVGLILVMVVLLSLLVTTGYHKTFNLKLSEEDVDRRRSMLPFVIGMMAVMFLLFLFVTPAGTVPQ